MPVALRAQYETFMPHLRHKANQHSGSAGICASWLRFVDKAYFEAMLLSEQGVERASVSIYKAEPGHLTLSLIYMSLRGQI